jgi:PAS domain S-box-containing protein
MSTLQVLLLEDKLLDTQAIQAMLTDDGVDYELLRVDTRTDFVTALETQAFDLILAAYATPGFDGIAALEIAGDRCPDVPFIFVCASLGEELAIEALKRGATDYVLKQRLERLVPCVQRALREAQERRKRKRAERMLIEQKQLLELIASGQPIDDCLAAVCASVSWLNPRIRACFLLTDAQRLTFNRSITPDFPPSFGQGLKNAPIDELAIGTCGMAVYCGEPVTCADIANDDRWAQEWRDLCTAHGILACHFAPVLSVENLPLGSLMLCLDEARTLTDWECQLAEFGAQVASIVFERDRSNFALRESEAKYRTLLESIDEGFCICEMLFDKNGTPIDYQFLEVNSIFESMTGLEQATGKTVRELVPNLEADWFEVYGRVVRTGEAIRFENQSIAMNRWFEVNAFRIGEPQSNQFAVLFTNITARKKAEQERDRFLAVGSDLQVITGSSGYFQWVSPTFERVLGWTIDEMTSRPWTDFVHPDDINPSVSETVNLFSGRGTFAFENRYQHKDGSYRWFFWNAQPYPDEQVIYGAAVDITDRKRTEQNAELLSNVSQSLVEAIDVDEIVQTVGEQLHRYLKTSICAFVEINQTQDEAAINYDWHQEDVPSVVGVYSLLEFVTDEFLQAAKAGQPLVVYDVTSDPRIVDPQRYAPLKIGAEVNVPLIRDGEWKFSLAVFHQTPYNWRTDEIELMRELAIRIWNRLERTRAEVALRESEARLRFMLNASQIGDWDLDLTTQPYIAAHRSLRHDQIFGYESVLPEWSYEIFLTHVHPDDRAAVSEKFQQTLSASTDWNFECRIIHPDQSVHWIWTRSSVYCDQNGTPTRLLGMVLDVTDRKQAEAALQESEEQSRNILESITDAFFALDEDWRFTYVNQTACALVGRTPSDLIGQVFWKEFPGVNDSAFEQMHRRVMRDRVAESLTEFYPDHDRWYEVRSYPAVNGVTMYFRNVTAQIQAEAALQEQTNLLQLIINSIGDGLILANPQGEFVLVNQAAERIFGRLTNERSCDEWSRTYGLFLPDQQTFFPNEQLPLYRAIRGEYVNDVEVFVRHDPASEGRWISISGVPVLDASRAITGGVITCRDLTDRKRILQQEQAARKEAERANRLKDEFLAVLSHELRSPLNPILGWTRLLQNGKLDAARQAEALKTIERNAKLQTQLIEDLLDISRIMQGKLCLSAAPVSLTFVISSAIETVRLAAQAKNIQIALDLDPEIAPISGDATRLQQVVWNLLTNAVKFTPNGGQVIVELRQLDRLVQIRVIDTGKGITPNFLPHVFEYFRQEDGSTTRKFGGLGLGLAIVRQIVEMHGGTVWAESQGENQGATFIVQLPAMQQATLTGSEPTRTQADAEMPLDGIQILLVDDEMDTREFQAFVLEQSGANVTAVASGLEALRALDQFIPDAIVSDVGMAQMDGYMLMQQIRLRPAAQGGTIRAIALTAYAAEVDQQKALRVGFQAHITKPVEPEVLVKAIASLFRGN